jgi:MFS family permease
MVAAKQRDLFDEKQPTGQEAAAPVSWRALLTPRWMAALSILLGGVLLHSMNVLITATLLPSVVVDIGGADLMSWPTTAFVASSIIAATGTGILTAAIGARRSFSAGAAIYCTGAVVCGLAPSMSLVIAGRFVQGFGGGLLSAVAYVLVRNVFPTALWPRVFGLLAGVWTASTLCGPLIGGLFAGYGFWRGAFFAVAVLGSLLSLLTLSVLPRDRVEEGAMAPQAPVLRVTLVCAGIAMLSLASVASGPAAKVACIAAGIGAFTLMMRIDRSAPVGLLPSDAFSLHSATGLGLWIVLLLSVAYSPLFIFAPLFLQQLHALSPLTAGYMVAAASLTWTAAAIGVASLPDEWPARLIVVGPVSMGVGLLGFGALMATAPVAALIPPIVLIGGGIGACWAFILQRVMGGARQGEGNIAASSVATVQQAGLALGAASAGLVANAGGLSDSLVHDAIVRAAFWVPVSFVAAPLAAGAMAIRLNVLTPRVG